MDQSDPGKNAKSTPATPTPSRDRYLRTPLASFPFDLQARLADATSVQDVYDIGVAIMARIPATICIRIFQRDDNGQLVLVHAWQSPLAEASSVTPRDISQSVHQRWIAAHRVGNSDLEFSRPFLLPDHNEWLIVPMLASNELIGAIASERRDGESFPYTAEDVIAFSSAAAGMSWGIQALYLRDRTDLLSNKESREEIIARERREIGRELHDNVVQNLAYLKMKMELIERYATTNPDIAKSEIQGVRDLIDKSITELRRTIGQMRRPTPPRRGITGQLRSVAKNIEIDASDFELDLKQISGVQLVPEVERSVVGIVREALQNVRKHAEASSVRLEVYREGDTLRVVVADDGVGIEHPEGESPVDHFGMTQMRELAEDLGGQLTVESSPGTGTRIEAQLPLVLPANASESQQGSGLGASEFLDRQGTNAPSEQG